jgi:cell wall assembly regulator SMI1
VIDWSSLLQRWHTQRQTADADTCMTPATNGEIQALADRLGIALPPSYVAFLRVTNGRGPVSPFISRLRCVEDVDWFRVENEMWIGDFQGCGVDALSPEFFDYSLNCGGDYFEGHLEGTLQISDVDDGVVLMNPEIVTPDGEWEVWFFASWLPGAMRYPSFGHWMVHEY